ncbi:Alpha/Beta hydrolase protein [Sordaria sp. MPI-SDFR-AT-0083]|nr:Alpha/Beta hydrolase protein [Sordaria sp. MPI-SDFR-AT-0083]
MSFLNLNLSYQSIHFRHPSSSSSSPIHLPTLPSGISRSFIPTALGDLEIVHTSPSQQSQPALFFIHGGMGSASVWLEYLSFFSAALQEQQIPCYAVSMRGHGGSWYPSYLRMVYGTTKGDLAGDVVEGIKWAADRERERRKVWEGERRNADNVEERENREVEMILVGHSSGGGLAQYILSAGLLDGLGVKIKGLVLMGAVPGFGSLPVYLNWFRLDPLFTLRMILHGWHPNSPLSHPSLSFLWPLGMGWRFVDPEKVLLQISDWDETRARVSGEGKGKEGQRGQQRVLVIAGEKDKIMTPDIMQKLAEWYRAAYGVLVVGKKIDGVVRDTEEDEAAEDIEEMEEGRRDMEDGGMGVRYAIVPGAGHHCQNDVGWEVGAGKVLEFYRQLL